MQVGVLKETKRDETRVGLTPVLVAKLVATGHGVRVERGAGVSAGFADTLYEAAGAGVVTRKSVLDSCELIVKIKEPLESEFAELDARHTLMSYLHLDGNTPVRNVQAIVARGLTAFAYEWLEVDGGFPLLEPMSRLTGYLVAQKCVEFCTHYRGILCGGHEPDLPGANVFILGMGHIGSTALKYFADIGAQVTLLDRNPATVSERIRGRFPDSSAMQSFVEQRLHIVPFDDENPCASQGRIAEIVRQADIVINCAVRRENMPRERLRYLVSEAMVRSMAPGSVVCDATASDRDLVETCVPSDSLHGFDVIHDVIHYNCDHVPACVGRQATEILTAAAFPWVQRLANEGIMPAVRRYAPLRSALSCRSGRLTHAITAKRKGLECWDTE